VRVTGSYIGVSDWGAIFQKDDSPGVTGPIDAYIRWQQQTFDNTGLCCFFLQHFCKVWNVHGSNTTQIMSSVSFLKATPGGNDFRAKCGMTNLSMAIT